MLRMETTRDSVPRGVDQDWRAAGAAWGSRASDWACLYEHYALDVILAFVTRLAIGPGTALLDVACGSGLAVRVADGMGAHVAGIDASENLVAVARERTPRADLRVGSMYALPWADASFDVVVSVNGIWGGCGDALDEIFRVLRPGGLIGISFWGAGPPLDIRTFFRIFAEQSPSEHRGSMRRLNDISVAGVAETMLTASGFEDCERDGRTSVIEWPDAEIAWRAISSIGPAVPALLGGDREELRRAVLEALEPCRDACGIYRTRSDQQFVTARKR
jgi:SAM-dependent methyltransferase